MTSADLRPSVRTRSVIATVIALVLVGVGIAIWATGGSLLLAAACAALGLLVAALAPGVIGRARRASTSGATPDAETVKRWREQHPGASIADAVDALRK